MAPPHGDHHPRHPRLVRHRRVRGGVHDVIGTRCDPYTNHLLSGGDYHWCCHSNLVRALAAARDLPLAEAEGHVHDVVNVFMCTGYTRDTNQYFMKASPSRPGDFIELFAEIDLLARCPPARRRLRSWSFQRRREVPPVENRDPPAARREPCGLAAGVEQRVRRRPRGLLTEGPRTRGRARQATISGVQPRAGAPVPFRRARRKRGTRPGSPSASAGTIPGHDARRGSYRLRSGSTPCAASRPSNRPR